MIWDQLKGVQCLPTKDEYVAGAPAVNAYNIQTEFVSGNSILMVYHDSAQVLS